jgi:hypothetical protein
MTVRVDDGTVWLTLSDFKNEDVVVHGAFTSEDAAEQCAAEVKKLYPRRETSVGSWHLNLSST